MSGAVLKVVADDHAKPTREEPPGPPPLPPPPPPPPRLPATSRRRPPPLPVPAPIEVTGVVAVPWRSTFATTVRLSDPPLPRHRVRSGFLLVVLVVTVGTMVAVLIGAAIAALAFALRAAVTS